MKCDVSQSFSRHYEDLYRFAFRLLGSRDGAEDAVQEAFLRLAGQCAAACEVGPVAARDRRSARPGHVEKDGVGASFSGGEEAVRRWLFVVVRNLCVSRLRREAARRAVPLDDRREREIGSRNPDPAQAAVAGERGRWVAEAVASLSPEMREAVILREYEGMSYVEIADIAGCSVGTVRSRLARARDKLRELLRPLLEEKP